VTNTIQIQNQIRNQYKVKPIQINEYNTDQIQKQIYKQMLECSTSSTKTNCWTHSTLGQSSAKLSSKAVPTLRQRCGHFQKNLGKAKSRLRESSGKAAKSSTTLHRELDRKLSSKTPRELPQSSSAPHITKSS